MKLFIVLLQISLVFCAQFLAKKDVGTVVKNLEDAEKDEKDTTDSELEDAKVNEDQDDPISSDVTEAALAAQEEGPGPSAEMPRRKPPPPRSGSEAAEARRPTNAENRQSKGSPQQQRAQKGVVRVQGPTVGPDYQRPAGNTPKGDQGAKGPPTRAPMPSEKEIEAQKGPKTEVPAKSEGAPLKKEKEEDTAALGGDDLPEGAEDAPKQGDSKGNKESDSAFLQTDEMEEDQEDAPVNEDEDDTESDVTEDGVSFLQTGEAEMEEDEDPMSSMPSEKEIEAQKGPKTEVPAKSEGSPLATTEAPHSANLALDEESTADEDGELAENADASLMQTDDASVGPRGGRQGRGGGRGRGGAGRGGRGGRGRGFVQTGEEMEEDKDAPVNEDADDTESDVTEDGVSFLQTDDASLKPKGRKGKGKKGRGKKGGRR